MPKASESAYLTCEQFHCISADVGSRFAWPAFAGSVIGGLAQPHPAARSRECVESRCPKSSSITAAHRTRGLGDAGPCLLKRGDAMSRRGL
ncbi:hypothetical protein NDU88_009526 [Pleurodeles waltl]|uniref:Uncharacterized protein n=1 Tax=Pleurodeles waltl TaxID=8319 RepID=A0AAV7RVG9_PLEWA|nr:hypothetical protein NDU88_009526 [Pleurodeles waltl]